MEYMPAKLTKKEVMEKIATRQDFNFLMESYKTFSLRGAEDVITKNGNVRETKWAYKQHEKMKEIVNKERAKHKEELMGKELYSRGKPLGYTIGDTYVDSAREKTKGRVGMFDVREVQMRPITRDPSNMGKKEFEKSFMGLEKQLLDSGSMAKKELYKENYIKAMIKEGLDSELQDLIASLPADLVVDTLYVDSEAHIDFIYTKNDQINKNHELMDVWGSAIERSNYGERELKEIFSKKKLSDNMLSLVIENVNVKPEALERILTDSGYAPERVKQILS